MENFDYRSFEKQAKECIMQNNETLRSWSVESMTIYLRDGEKCVYCDFPLWDSFGLGYYFASLDHILPRKYFEIFSEQSWNKVPCCRSCNALKRSFNPDEDSQVDKGNVDFIPSVELRAKWIATARSHIQGRKKERDQRFIKEIELMRDIIKSAKK
jgi:hypothetical protein